ncbi:MAG TPA: hypothetical protein VM432_08235 [Bdellovibrionales bacterium]|nr:hypothetical protein [Bdellovibrionales bacterium]
MKFKSVVFTGAIIGAITFAAGCAKQEEKEAPYIGVQGSWQSNCVSGESAALLGPSDLGITQHSELKITKAEVIETSYVSSSECDGKDIEVISTGRYHAVGNGLQIEDITYHVKPLTEFGLRVLRIAQWCGISDWSLKESRDVTSEAGKEKCFSSRQATAQISIGESDMKVKESDRMQSSFYGMKSGLYFKRR